MHTAYACGPRNLPPPLSPTVSFFFLHRQSSSSALLDYALGTERSPRHGHLLSIYFFCVVLFPCIDDTADLFISNEIRSYSVAEYDHHRHHLCGDIFSSSSSSSAIQSNDVADQQREREFRAGSHSPIRRPAFQYIHNNDDEWITVHCTRPLQLIRAGTWIIVYISTDRVFFPMQQPVAMPQELLFSQTVPIPFVPSNSIVRRARTVETQSSSLSLLAGGPSSRPPARLSTICMSHFHHVHTHTHTLSNY